jgi:hypothetical protein
MEEVKWRFENSPLPLNSGFLRHLSGRLDLGGIPYVLS